jgi:hypothetical protein
MVGGFSYSFTRLAANFAALKALLVIQPQAVSNSDRHADSEGALSPISVLYPGVPDRQHDHSNGGLTEMYSMIGMVPHYGSRHDLLGVYLVGPVPGRVF